MSSEEDKSAEQPQPPPPPPEEPGAPAPSPAAADKRPRGRPRKDGASPFQRARKNPAPPSAEELLPVIAQLPGTACSKFWKRSQYSHSRPKAKSTFVQRECRCKCG